jgi:hypothetical protein
MSSWDEDYSETICKYEVSVVIWEDYEDCKELNLTCAMECISKLESIVKRVKDTELVVKRLELREKEAEDELPNAVMFEIQVLGYIHAPAPRRLTELYYKAWMDCIKRQFNYINESWYDDYPVY